MSVRRMFLSVLIVAASTVVFSQSTQTPPLQQPEPNASATATSNPCEIGAPNQVEILTDTMNVDLVPYITELVKTVRTNWYSLVPPAAYPPVEKPGKVSIDFQVLPNGKVVGMRTHTSSGDVSFDRAAWGSITASSPFRPLPGEFRGTFLGLRFYYIYNLEVLKIAISPCIDVRVAAGSTQQFSASRKGVAETSVTWNVSGLGCSKSDCGTISGSGLYTAPVNIPIPPIVVVEVTSQTNMGASGRTKLTLLPANSSP
jgi:TonB family protein